MIAVQGGLLRFLEKLHGNAHGAAARLEGLKNLNLYKMMFRIVMHFTNKDKIL